MRKRPRIRPLVSAQRPELSWTVCEKSSRRCVAARRRKQQRAVFQTAGRYFSAVFRPCVDRVWRVSPRPPYCNTFVCFERYMLLHSAGSRARHPERPERMLLSWNLLAERGLVTHCELAPSRLATAEELLACHSAQHVANILATKEEGFVDGGDTYTNEYTAEAARLAAGTLIDLTLAVVRGQKRNGFALLRPPGHHATKTQAMGFCFFNNVAVAARAALREPGVNRVLIVDWDVHHGNGTEDIFYEDPNVLFVSLHGHDGGAFYPGTGHLLRCGAGAGQGFNINIPWSCFGVGDEEYLAAFQSIVVPVAQVFQPDLVLVSAGFDAALGDPLGNMRLTPAGYQGILRLLLPLAGGKVVLALEGGYNLDSTARCVQACMEDLLRHGNGEDLPGIPSAQLLRSEPDVRVQCAEVLSDVRTVQRSFWPS
eukprot:RCo045097